ncbi:MAG: PD-(D/E)XK nuclease family protein [Bacteroidaceae bacterium]|nr:PD-(D/E)XK nuclease family protein [Bacteroidaceae bacterium]
MTNWTVQEIKKVAELIEGSSHRASRGQNPYNLFTAWKMSENDHTKMFLALMRYRDASGRYALLNSFLNRFAKGRGKMIHYQNISDVNILFNPRYKNDTANSFIDGLITFTANGRPIAVIVENKIYDAPDQPNQISRYIEHMTKDEGVDVNNVWVFYMTGDGSKEVEEQSYGCDAGTDIGRRFVPLAYNSDIINWLKSDILEARIYPEALTSVVRSYVESLEKDLFAEDNSDNQRMDKLCNSVIGHHNLKKVTMEQCNTLYAFRRAVAEVRNQMREDIANGSAEDMHVVDNLYAIVRKVIQKLEQLAFGVFEESTATLLNEHWKRELKKHGGVRWTVAHRGVGGDNGFLQVRLGNEWESAHWEWMPVSTAKMFTDTEYTLELHVERNVALANKWREHLRSNAVMLPQSADLGKDGTRTVLCYRIETPKPIAQMKEAELKELLKSIYLKKLNYLCRMLVNEFGAYNV